MADLTEKEKRDLVFHVTHGCKVSTGIDGGLTFGTGDLDRNGFWSIPCLRDEKIERLLDKEFDNA